MNAAFNVIGIFGRVKNQGVIETLEALVQYLESLNKELVIETETALLLDCPQIKVVPRHEISKHCELLIVVGGDGSLLNAAHAVVERQIPVLGINRGRLGFLTDILPLELEKIGPILNGHYRCEERFLLTARVEKDNELIGKSDALNEVAMIPDTVPHMNEFEVYVNDQFVCSQDSDGIIVATPTGSTAYALSGGGPIIHPELDAVVIVPMFPHTLSMRPWVIHGNSKLRIVISPENTATPRLTCDGQAFINTPAGSVIHIEKKEKHLRLVHPLDYDYYASLRSKLHWGRKLSLG